MIYLVTVTEPDTGRIWDEWVIGDQNLRVLDFRDDVKVVAVAESGFQMLRPHGEEAG